MCNFKHLLPLGFKPLGIKLYFFMNHEPLHSLNPDP